MAEHQEKLNPSESKCCVCNELFTDSVKLPCEHRFCLVCLEANDGAHSDRFFNDDQALDIGISEPVEQSSARPKSFQCPVCQSTDEDELVCDTGKRSDDGKAKCSLCTEGPPKDAVVGCVSCRCLYCLECRVTCHPMRGPLAKHVLVKAGRFLSTPACEEHDEPLRVFCDNCKQLYCYICSVKYHGGHDLKEPTIALTMEKDRMATRTSELREAYEEVSSRVEGLVKTEEDIKKCCEDDRQKIEAQYQGLHVALISWRSGVLEAIGKRRDSLLGQTKAEMDKLQSQLTEIYSCLREKTEYFKHADAISFLMMSGEATKSLGTMISETQATLVSFESQQKDVNKKLVKQPLPDTELLLTEGRKDGSVTCRFDDKTLLCPTFSLRTENAHCLFLLENGKLLVNRRQCQEEKCYQGAWADRAQSNTKIYWEMDVAYRERMAPVDNTLVYSAGVLHRRKEKAWYIGGDQHSWGVAVHWLSSYKYTFWHNDKCMSTVPLYPEGSPQGGSVRQGFYLDCVARTLTILDCSNARILHTFSDLDLSKPLTPAVAVYNFDTADVSVRLRTGRDICSPPASLLQRT